MTVCVANLDLLISRMSALREDQFDMRFLYRESDGGESFEIIDHNVCGTAACIAGECGIIAVGKVGAFWHGTHAMEWLGIDFDAALRMFTPPGYAMKGRYPLSRALRMLRHLRAEYLRTGNVVVDWDAPETAEPALQPWAPPVVIAADKALPSSLTSLLREPVP